MDLVLQRFQVYTGEGELYTGKRCTDHCNTVTVCGLLPFKTVGVLWLISVGARSGLRAGKEHNPKSQMMQQHCQQRHLLHCYWAMIASRECCSRSTWYLHLWKGWLFCSKKESLTHHWRASCLVVGYSPDMRKTPAPNEAEKEVELESVTW